MKSQKTTAALIVAAFSLSAYAADEFSNDAHFYNVQDKSYTGDANTDAVIDSNATALPDAFNAAASTVSIKGYRDFRISNPSTGNWGIGIYVNYNSNVEIDVSQDIAIEAGNMGIHLLDWVDDDSPAQIHMNAGRNVTIRSGGNGVWVQNKNIANIHAVNEISVVTGGTTVGAMNANSPDSLVINLDANKIHLENTSGGCALYMDDKGGTFNLTAPEGITIVGDIDTVSGKVNIHGEESNIAVRNGNYAHFGEIEGQMLNFYFDDFAEGTRTFTVADDQADLINVYMGHEGIDDLTSEEAAEALEDLYATGKRVGNGTNYTVTIDENGNVTVDGSDITKMTNDLAAMSLVAWRNEITTLNDRMSTLRTSPATIGVWARYNGGEYQYDGRSLKNQFNTIEVGADAKVADNWIVGASFSYTKGDGDLDLGETDTDTYSGALYALWTHEKGSFVDFVMKAGRMENDFDFHNLTGGAYDSGSLDHTGFILGIETGHRFTLPMNTFIEPQVQLTYSRLSSVSETTAARHVELDAMDSLIGRVGIMAGIECPNDRGSAYVKVSALRDFRGDIDGTYSVVGGTGAYSLSQELDDNWFEYAIGGNFKLTDNAYLFADVAKSAGGDIDLDWRANVGAKLFF